MNYCDLCGSSAHCVRKEIDGREFDLCDSCWDSLAEKLSGKGHPKGILEHLEGEMEACEELSIY